MHLNCVFTSENATRTLAITLYRVNATFGNLLWGLGVPVAASIMDGGGGGGWRGGGLCTPTYGINDGVRSVSEPEAGAGAGGVGWLFFKLKPTALRRLDV